MWQYNADTNTATDLANWGSQYDSFLATGPLLRLGGTSMTNVKTGSSSFDGVNPRSMRHKSSHISEDNPVVVRGRSIGLESYGSPTTSNQTLVDFPCLKIGPGESSRSHKADEFIMVSEIEGAVETYVKLLDNLQI